MSARPLSPTGLRELAADRTSASCADSRIVGAAMARGFQTRDAEMALSRMLGELTNH